MLQTLRYWDHISIRLSVCPSVRLSVKLDAQRKTELNSVQFSSVQFSSVEFSFLLCTEPATSWLATAVAGSGQWRTGDGRRQSSPIQCTAGNWTELNSHAVKLSSVQFSAVHWAYRACSLTEQRTYCRQCRINLSGDPMPTRNGGPSNPLPSPSLPLPSDFPSLPLEVGPLKYRYGVWGSAVSSPSGVCGGAPAEIEFGAF